MADYFEFALRNVDADSERIVRRRGLESKGKVQRKVDSETLRLMYPYVPFDTGALIDNGIINSVIGSGKIVYKGPYARKQYYIPMNHGNGGKRCAYWFEEMKNSGGKEKILEAAKRMAGAK